MAVVDELLAIGEEDRRRKQFLQDNPLFGMEPYHEVRPTYSNRYTEAVGSLLEPLMTKPDAGPLDINFWTGLLSTPLVKSMRPREEPTKMEYAFSGVPFTPGLGVAPSLGRAAAKRFIPEFDPSRRQFLKTSATVGALTGLGIPLAKKALTKSAGAIESLAEAMSERVLKADRISQVNQALHINLKGTYENLDNVLRNIRLNLIREKQVLGGKKDDVFTEGVKDEWTGEQYKDLPPKIKSEMAEYELDSVSKMNEHIGDYNRTRAEYSPEENQWEPLELSDIYKKDIDATGIVKDEIDNYWSWGADSPNQIGWADRGVDLDFGLEVAQRNKEGMTELFNDLNYFEKTDPKLFIKVIDKEIDRIGKINTEGDKGIVSTQQKRDLVIRELLELRDKIKLPDKPKPKKKEDDVSIVQRVLDPLGYTRMKAPYEK